MSWSPSFFRACKNNKTNSEIEVIDKLDKRILLPPPHPSNGLGFSCFLNYYFFFLYACQGLQDKSASPTHPPPPTPFSKTMLLVCIVQLILWLLLFRSAMWLMGLVCYSFSFGEYFFYFFLLFLQMTKQEETVQKQTVY